MKRGFFEHFCKIRLSVHEYSDMSAGEMTLRSTIAAAWAGPELVEVRDDRLVLGDDSRLESHRDASDGAPSPSVVVGLRFHTCDSRTTGGGRRVRYSLRKMLLKPSRARLRIVIVDVLDSREKEEKMEDGLCGRGGTSALICRMSRPRFIQFIGTASDDRFEGSGAVLIESRGGRAESDCELFAV
jgi:hypothetical protein